MSEPKILSTSEKPAGEYDLDLIDHVHEGIYFLDGEQRITLWNPEAERITGYKGSEILGQACSKNVLSHVDAEGNLICLTDCPARLTLRDGVVRTLQVYVHHKEGYRLPISLTCLPRRNAAGELVGTAQIFYSLSPRLLMPQKGKELDQMVLLDPLTGLSNKQYLQMLIHSRLDELNRYGLSFGVIFVDVDRLKSVNDLYGPDVGDRILKTVSQTLASNVRFFETVGRWGPEEFLAIILNIDEQKLSLVANKLRVLVANSNVLVEPDLISVTISSGATLALPQDTVETLVLRAEQLMLQSKWLGRNRVSTKPVVK